MNDRRILWLLAAVLLGGCARSTTPDPVAEQDALLKRDAEWAAAASAGKDIEKIVSYWTEDAVLIPPGQPVFLGRAEIRAYVTNALNVPGFKVHWTSDKATVSPDAQLAWLSGRMETSLRGADGNVVTVENRVVTVWRRDRDGQWRCAVDIWNEPPGAPAPDTSATGNTVD